MQLKDNNSVFSLSYSDTKVPTVTITPNTGDDNNTAFLVSIAIISGLGVIVFIALYIVERKKEKNKR